MPTFGKLEITTPSDREIAMRREFDAPLRLVFDALTKPELLERWLHGPEEWTLVVCEIDLRPGGALRYVWRHQDGREMGMSGAYREVEPPRRIVHTELFDEDWTEGEAVVTTLLEEVDGGTVLTTTVLYTSQSARDGALQSGMERGVEASYLRLDELLARAA